MGISKDYRNTNKCDSLFDVVSKKEELDRKIRKKHKNIKIMYNHIAKKKDVYFREFAKIYNNKCAYCGAIIKFNDIHYFEIDHFVCKATFSDDTAGRAEAGCLKNLVFSCYLCNRGKGGLHIKPSYQDVLTPDDNAIAGVFYRDEDYCIQINDCYSEDNFIQLFYNALQLGHYARQLDFLLLEMDNLIDQLQIKNQELAHKLGWCKSILMQKKNCIL